MCLSYSAFDCISWNRLIAYYSFTDLMHLSMSSRREERQGIGRDFDRSLWPGVGHLNYLAVPGVGIFEFLFVLMTTNHFPGGEFQLYLNSHFCPGVGNLTAIFWKMSKSHPMPRFSPCRLDIDRCIIFTIKLCLI